MANANLAAAKSAKNDEFYTQYADIEKEVNAYLEFNPDTFRGKVVYSNCDDPYESNFFRYFVLNFKRLGLKQYIATSYKPSPIANTQLQLFGGNCGEDVQTKGRPKATANKFVINDVGDMDGDGQFNLSDIAEQLKANRNNEWAPMEGDGDFRSQECIDLLRQADIVATNPPFSLFREYLGQLVEYGKQLLIIGNMNAITYKELFPLIKENELWVGATNFNTGMYFNVPDHFVYASTYKFERERNGEKVNRVPGVCWYTNLDHGRRHQPLQLMTMADNLKFNKKMKGRTAYDRYDNYDAIEVPFTDAIPSDYDGAMGVPISFLDKYNPDQFQIVGRGEDIEWAESDDCTFFTPTTQELQKLYRKRDKTWRIQNQYLLDADGFAHTVYKRIFIRHRKAE